MERDGAQGCCPPWDTWNQKHFKPQVATYFLVNNFLYHKTIKFGTIVISTGRQQRGEQDWGVFWWAGWKGKGGHCALHWACPPAPSQPSQSHVVSYHSLQPQQGKGSSDHFRNQNLAETQTRRTRILDEKPLLAVVVQVAMNAREWPPSSPPRDYFAKKTKTQDSFLLNVPQRPIFLLSSETIAKPNVVQWK